MSGLNQIKILIAVLVVTLLVSTVGAGAAFKMHSTLSAQLETEQTKAFTLKAEVTELESKLATVSAEASAAVEAANRDAQESAAQAEAVRQELEQLKAKMRKSSTQSSSNKPPTAPIVTAAGADGLTSDQVAEYLSQAASYYGLSPEATAWIVNTGLRISYRESHYNPWARNGQHVGLFQFNDNWGSVEQRQDPVWSCYRFVKVYVDGGEAKIRQHWAATY